MIDDILDDIAAQPYEQRGIPHSEMALILFLARSFGIEVFLESGRARAQSTYMLAKYLPHVEIHSVELRGGPDQDFGTRRVSGFENVNLAWGDGAVLLPELAARVAPRRTAVLCDGPKGAAAVNVIKSCFAHSNVVLGFVHDMRRLDHGAPSPHRAAAVAAFPSVCFSDDPALTTGTKWLDAKVVEAGGPVGPAHEAEFGSYGPTIGVFTNLERK